MKQRLPSLLLLSCAAGLGLSAAPSDILPPGRRKPSLELAATLSAYAPVDATAAGLPSPFSPPGFGDPDPDELAALLAAKNAAASQVKPATDGDKLNEIAAKLDPSGTAVFGGEQVLLFPGKQLHRGDRFVITYEGRDFELELTDIQRTTFSLRYNRTEITRPIKLGKTK